MLNIARCFMAFAVCSQQLVLLDLPGDYFSFIPLFPCTVINNLQIFIFVAPALAGRLRRTNFRTFVRPSVRSSVRPFVFPSIFTLGVLWAQLLLQF